MHWVQRKIYLYNVTFGLYMLDWWERYLFNTLVIVLMWFIFYNSSRYVADFCRSKKLVTTTLVSEWLKLDSIIVIIQALFLIGIIEFAKADLSADEVDDKNCLH